MAVSSGGVAVGVGVAVGSGVDVGVDVGVGDGVGVRVAVDVGDAVVGVGVGSSPQAPTSNSRVNPTPTSRTVFRISITLPTKAESALAPKSEGIL